MIEELKGRLGSLNKALEFFYLINDLKPVCRFGFYEQDINNIKKLCFENKLHITTSNFKVLLDSRENINDFNNKGYKTSLLNPFPGMIFTYISKDMDLANLAKYLENANKIGKLGELLGYPDCCTDFFIQNMDEQAKKNNDFVLPVLNNSEGVVFPKELNIAARYFDFNLLPFFPHSFNCEKALKLAKAYLATIINNDPSLAADIARKLNCGVVYTENAGVCLLEDPKLDGEYLSYSNAVSTQKGRLLDELNTYGRINILDKNNLIVGPHMLKDVGVMVFE
ncbi:DUF483 domain-containing protein [Candidatus Woesearchaeota archaeon]|nr:DUF483 domain-containing protein [Candidatus Woesearchaeota archaeon]